MDSERISQHAATGSRPTWPPERIAVGLVLFHPPPETQPLVEAALGQFDTVFVVDNTPDAARMPEQAGARTPMQSACHIISNPANRGLAVAINQLGSAARRAGFDWLLLLDQDSLIAPDFAERLQTATQAQDQPPAIFAANYSTRLGATKLRGYNTPGDQATSPILTAINAGSLINLVIHQAMGGHDEALFVDHVDHEYCLRLRKNGQRIVASQAPLFEHQIGQVVNRHRFGRVWQSSGHSPERREEWARGLIWLSKRYWRTAPGWCAQRLLIEWPRHFLAMLLLEDQRSRKALALLRGLMGGIVFSPKPPQTYNP